MPTHFESAFVLYLRRRNESSITINLKSWKSYFTPSCLLPCFPASLLITTEEYKFTTEDYQYLPAIYEELGKNFKFKNELNEVVEITVNSYIQETIYLGSGYGGTTSHAGNYESLIIGPSVTGETHSNCIAKSISIHKIFDGSLKIFLESNTIPYPCSSSSILQSIQSPFEYSSMNIDGVTYDRTIIFNYENNAETPFSIKIIVLIRSITI